MHETWNRQNARNLEQTECTKPGIDRMHETWNSGRVGWLRTVHTNSMKRERRRRRKRVTSIVVEFAASCRNNALHNLGMMPTSEDGPIIVCVCAQKERERREREGGASTTSEDGPSSGQLNTQPQTQILSNPPYASPHRLRLGLGQRTPPLPPPPPSPHRLRLGLDPPG
jgi:hypothetical protein